MAAFPPIRRGEARRHSWCRACFAENNARYYRENIVVQKARLLRSNAIRRLENRRRLAAYLRQHPCVDCGESDIVVLDFDHIGPKRASISTMLADGRSWASIQREIAQCVVRCANCHRVKTAKDWPLPFDRSSGRPRRRDVVQLRISSALGVRQCRLCRRPKPLVEFPFRVIESDRQTRQWICLACQRAYSKQWYEKNRERQIASAGRNTKRRRGDRAGEVLRLRQASTCADCGERNPLLLDFDHVRDKHADVSSLVHTGRSSAVIESELAKCVIRCANCHRRKTATEQGWYRLAGP